MMFKLIGIALTGVVVVTLLKNSKPEFSVFATIATGVVMVITMPLFLKLLQQFVIVRLNLLNIMANTAHSFL